MLRNKGKVVLAQPAAEAPPPRAALSPSPRPRRRLPLPRAPLEPAPVRGAGEDAAYWAGLRYRGLLHDYQQLLEETDEKKRRLHMRKLVKRRLLAEVRFLRKRYKSMAENPSQTIVCRLKNPSMPPAPALRSTSAAWADAVDFEHRSVPAAAVGSSSWSLPARPRQLGPPMTSPVIDLNEACEPIHEEMEIDEYHGCRQPPAGINNTKRHYPLEGDGAAGSNSVRMPVFWDIQNPAVPAGKRKISYQDPLVLGV